MPWVCFAVLSCTIATTLTPNRYTQHLFVYIQVAFVYSAFKLIETVFLCRKMYTLPAYARPYKTIAARATILRQNSIELSKNKHKHTQNGTRCHYYFSCTQNLCQSFALETHNVCLRRRRRQRSPDNYFMFYYMRIIQLRSTLRGTILSVYFFYTMHLSHANFNLYGGLHFVYTVCRQVARQDTTHDQGARRYR